MQAGIDAAKRQVKRIAADVRELARGFPIPGAVV